MHGQPLKRATESRFRWICRIFNVVGLTSILVTDWNTDTAHCHSLLPSVGSVLNHHRQSLSTNGTSTHTDSQSTFCYGLWLLKSCWLECVMPAYLPRVMTDEIALPLSCIAIFCVRMEHEGLSGLLPSCLSPNWMDFPGPVTKFDLLNVQCNLWCFGHFSSIKAQWFLTF
jgi:hypothetical protein